MSEIDSVMLFSGNANIDLAREVSDQLGIPLGNCTVSKFSDGEAHIEILENVRGRDVFVLQPTCVPTNDHLMEMLIMVDALYRASAGRITAVMPYYGYARQDRRVRSRRVPISAKLVADMISTSRVDRVLTIDLHSDQIQGFFDLPVDNIYASAVLLDDINEKKYENLVVVSPDVGGVVRARAMTKSLESLGGEVGLAIIDKRRPEPNVSAVMHIIGEVENKTCVIIDDMVDTAGTLCHAAKALKDHGAKQVIAYATHPVFSGPAINNIENSELDEVVVTNTIPLSESGSKCAKIRQLSVASILSDTISRVHVDASVSDLFSHVVDD